MAEQGEARAPRAWLSISGKTVNIMAFEARLVRGNGQPSTADVTLALDDPTVPPADFWSRGGIIEADLHATSAGKTDVILYGYIDYATVDFGTRTVSAQMRDRGLPLSDTRSDAKWENHTTSQIVTELASFAGLSVNAGPGSRAGHTTDGKIFTFNSDLQTPLDVIQELAYQDGYVAFVSNNTLHYVRSDTAIDGTYSIEYKPPHHLADPAYDESNSMRLVCTHNFELGGGVQNEVNSFQQWNNQSVTGLAGAGRYKSAERHPGLEQDQVDKRAMAGQRYIAEHEYTAEVECPGDVTVKQTMMLSISGTESAFDMTYYIYEVVHRMDDENGYTMDITGHRSAPGDDSLPSAPDAGDQEAPGP